MDSSIDFDEDLHDRVGRAVQRFGRSNATMTAKTKATHSRTVGQRDPRSRFAAKRRRRAKIQVVLDQAPVFPDNVYQILAEEFLEWHAKRHSTCEAQKTATM